MANAEKIEKAIAAHAGWKARLRSAAISGKFEGSSASVRVDNACDFGKWLYGSELSVADKQSEHYRTVKQLHAEFHQEAAKVVDLVTSGQKDVVEKAIAMGSPYANVSSQLILALTKWRNVGSRE